MNILVYYQNPQRTVLLESLVQSFVQKGHTVHFLTTCDRGILHQKVEERGAIAVAHNPTSNRLFQLISHFRFLVAYCRKNKIDVVYSHLQFANLVAVLARYFMPAKVFPCRHHADEVMMVGNKNALRIDKLVNKFAKKIIVVSNAVKKHMVSKENVAADKIVMIPLGYNFDLYAKPDPQQVTGIRQQLNCQLLLIVIARMTTNKRHIIALEVLNRLVKEGLDITMLLLDHGAEEQNLRAFVSENQLTERAIFTGFLNNTMDYVAASDLLVHPSLIEASNQVVKEAAILSVPSVACKGIGDFDEYFVHGQNGFLVSQENTADEICGIIREYYNKKDELKRIGNNLRKEVLDRFDIKKVSEQYLMLNN